MTKTNYERDMEDTLRQIAEALGAEGSAPDADKLIALAHEHGRNVAYYRRLRVLGCAPRGSAQLNAGNVLCFQNLDEFMAQELAANPSRGEAK